MSVKIQNSDIGDLEEIVDLNYNIFSGMYENKPYSLFEYRDRLVDKESVIFIATESDKIIGDSIAYKDGDGLYLWILGVNKEYRSLGIGKQLLQKNKEYAKNNNLALIKVKVFGVSVEMRQLLENNGYKIIKIEKSQKAEKYDVYYFALQIQYE
ncbi:MAG: GNAT family N-acetyltransferase [Candidatus Magasanikbacteria bacterium]|jgi:ribosomal protein S18 acetylase RimI-like enzyme